MITNINKEDQQRLIEAHSEDYEIVDKRDDILKDNVLYTNDKIFEIKTLDWSQFNKIESEIKVKHGLDHKHILYYDSRKEIFYFDDGIQETGEQRFRRHLLDKDRKENPDCIFCNKEVDYQWNTEYVAAYYCPYCGTLISIHYSLIETGKITINTEIPKLIMSHKELLGCDYKR